MYKYPKVFLVILNYNGKEVVERCLKSVFQLDYPNFEIVLVDNDSVDGSLELARKAYPKVHFIKNKKNLGYATGNNVGIRWALEKMADYVLLLNNDTEVENDFLLKLVEVAESDRKIGLISPLIFQGKTRKIWFSGGEILWHKMKTQHQKDLKKDLFYETSFITGCAMLVKKEVFKQIGLLDEDFFLYWEDADFSWRAKKAGFKSVVVSLSRVYHFEASEKNKENKTYWLVFSGLLFFKKNATHLKKCWIGAYLAARKIKNFWKTKTGNEKIDVIVKKAYRDFKDAKF